MPRKNTVVLTRGESWRFWEGGSFQSWATDTIALSGSQKQKGAELVRGSNGNIAYNTFPGLKLYFSI